jgi:hypothetical protein
MLRNFHYAGLCALLLAVFSGCVTMSRTDANELREIRELGLPMHPEGASKDLDLAAFLSLTGFGGNIYLAIGSDQAAQWAYGFINFLFWPFSVAWAFPQAIIDAHTMNKLETLYYYRFDPRGKAALDEARARAGRCTAAGRQ